MSYLENATLSFFFYVKRKEKKMEYYLDFQKPSQLSPTDVQWIMSTLNKFGYNSTKKDVMQMARKKRTVFLRDNEYNAVRGYVEMSLRGKTMNIDWLFAPTLGEIMMGKLMDYIRTETPKVKQLKLLVEVDQTEEKAEKMTKARLNLYFKSGFTIDQVEFVKNVTVYQMNQQI
jgi:hypothetical protein